MVSFSPGSRIKHLSVGALGHSWGTCSDGKWIDDDQTIVALIWAQVFGEHLTATGGTGGLNGRGDPKGDLKPNLCRQRRLEKCNRVFLDGKTQPAAPTPMLFTDLCFAPFALVLRLKE
jgi:hypothetical protein